MQQTDESCQVADMERTRGGVDAEVDDSRLIDVLANSSTVVQDMSACSANALPLSLRTSSDQRPSLATRAPG